MAEKTKDSTDRLLESMFQTGPVADDGFSNRVVARIRRGIWVRRLALPIAMLIGAAIAVKPATQLLVIVPRLLEFVPADTLSTAMSLLPQLQLVVLGGMILAIGVAFIQSLAD